MKKIILTFIIATCSFAINYAQQLADNSTLLVSYPSSMSSREIESMKARYRPENIITLPNTKVEVWTFLQFPTDMGFSDIIKVSEHVRSNTEVSSDPNWLTLNEKLPDDPNEACQLGLLPKCESYPLDICSVQDKNPILVAVTDCGISGSYNRASSSEIQFYPGSYNRASSSRIQFYPRPEHTWFTNKLWKNAPECSSWDNRDNDNNDYINDFTGWNWTTMDYSTLGDYRNEDENGHGTHVSGIVAQILDLASSKQVQLMSLKTQDKNGQGSLLSLIYAIDYAVGKKVNIMNLSLSYEGKKEHCDRSVLKAIMEIAGKQGNMLFVVASGNNKSDLDNPKEEYSYFPAYFKNDNMIVVGGSNCEGDRWEYSNYGATSVDIAAPAELVFSSVLESCAYKNGTSMATPFVTATAALIGSKQEVWDWQQAKEIILSTATVPQGNSHNQMWYNQSVTRGILNIPAALSCHPTHSKETNRDVISRITNTLATNPNPFSETLQIKIVTESDCEAELSIQNAYGQIVFHQNVTCKTGENSFEWQSKSAQQGIYIVKVQLNGQVLTQKIVKQ